MLFMWDSLVRLRMSELSTIHAWWSMLPAISRSLLSTWPSRLSQKTRCAIMSAGKCTRHAMGCDPAGYRDVSAALGCSWGVQGTAVGTGSTPPPHIYPEVL